MFFVLLFCGLKFNIKMQPINVESTFSNTKGNVNFTLFLELTTLWYEDGLFYFFFLGLFVPKS